MLRRTIKVLVGDAVLSYSVEGETCFGPEAVLLDEDDDLTRHQPWSCDGYTVAPFLSDDQFTELQRGIEHLVGKVVEEFASGASASFHLERYHDFGHDDSVHSAIVKKTAKGFRFSDLPIPPELIERRVGEICDANVTTWCPALNDRNFFVRIIRPGGKGDNNPPHRDAWLDHLRNAVNIYVPLASSNAGSSLPLAPGSHRWKESEIERTVQGAKIDSVSYTVPAVISAKRPLIMIRPNPRPNEVLVFSPYLIHGGGMNLNGDQTRVSLEMRFWRQL